MEPQPPGPRITIERKLEALVDQLAAFDQRLAELEACNHKICQWLNKLYEAVEPIVKEYNKRKKGVVNGTEISSDTGEREP
jgi:hypothetical protein